MQKQSDIEDALELMKMCDKGTLMPLDQFKPKLRHHIQGIIQGLQWVLDHNDPKAESLKRLLEQAKTVHVATGEKVSFCE